MKRFILNTIIFVALAGGLALALDALVTDGLKKTTVGDFQTWNDIYSSRIDADVIISGSSRATRNINTAILDTVLAVNSYNLGNDAYYLFMQYARYQTFAAHNPKPKLVIQTADFNTLWKTGSINRVQFAPYNDTLLDSFLQDVGFNAKELHAPVFRYFSEFSAVKLGIINQLGADNFLYKNEIKYKGYQPINKQWDGAILDNIIGSSHKILAHNEPSMVALLDTFLCECKRSDVQVVMVFTPEYIKAVEATADTAEVLNHYRLLSAKYGFPFLDYSRDSICYNTAYFYNALHLNQKGTDLFTEKLARDIEKIMNFTFRQD
ncbi:MAG: hypothetical protein LBN23_02700 [Paludibacter sp.]|nr:hypothetical protein [Paludibacter sp.]